MTDVVTHDDQQLSQPRLTQKGAAIALGVALLAFPLVPQLIDAVLPPPDWGTDEVDDTLGGAGVVDMFTPNGAELEVAVPDDWIPVNNGDSATFYGPGHMLMIQIYDRADRDVEMVRERLMRLNRVQGTNIALDGGRVSALDGEFTGRSCVAIADDVSGPCAFLSNDDIVVSMLMFVSPEGADEPAPPIAEVVELITGVSA